MSELTLKQPYDTGRYVIGPVLSRLELCGLNNNEDEALIAQTALAMQQVRAECWERTYKSNRHLVTRRWLRTQANWLTGPEEVGDRVAMLKKTADPEHRSELIVRVARELGSNAVVGFMVGERKLRPNDLPADQQAEYVELSTLQILPDHQNAGLGVALMSQFTDWAQAEHPDLPQRVEAVAYTPAAHPEHGYYAKHYGFLSEPHKSSRTSKPEKQYWQDLISQKPAWKERLKHTYHWRRLPMRILWRPSPNQARKLQPQTTNQETT